MSFAGGLRERMIVSRRAEARDAGGGAVGPWIELGPVWATARPVGPGPESADDARRGIVRWTVNLRPCDLIVGDRLGRTDGTLIVTAVARDPATPDRIAAWAEERR